MPLAAYEAKLPDALFLISYFDRSGNKKGGYDERSPGVSRSQSSVAARLVCRPRRIWQSAALPSVSMRLASPSAPISAIGVTFEYSRPGSKASIRCRADYWRRRAGQCPEARRCRPEANCTSAILRLLAGLPMLARNIETDARVVAITRRGIDKVASKDRADRPFCAQGHQSGRPGACGLFSRGNRCLRNLAQPQSAGWLRYRGGRGGAHPSLPRLRHARCAWQQTIAL